MATAYSLRFRRLEVTSGSHSRRRIRRFKPAFGRSTGRAQASASRGSIRTIAGRAGKLSKNSSARMGSNLISRSSPVMDSAYTRGRGYGSSRARGFTPLRKLADGLLQELSLLPEFQIHGAAARAI